MIKLYINKILDHTNIKWMEKITSHTQPYTIAKVDTSTTYCPTYGRILKSHLTPWHQKTKKATVTCGTTTNPLKNHTMH